MLPTMLLLPLRGVLSEKVAMQGLVRDFVVNGPFYGNGNISGNTTPGDDVFRQGGNL